MPTARTKANRKYNEKAYDRVYITVPKGKKDKIKAYCDEHNISVNEWINKLIDDKLI